METFDNNNTECQSFWKLKPVQIDNMIPKHIQLLSNDELLKKVLNDIHTHEYKLKYRLNDISDTPEIICEFINYIQSSDDIISLVYTPELIKYYMNNALTICFFSSSKSKKNKMIGLIIGKKETLSIGSELINSLEVNFLSLHPKLRNKNIAPLMINILTKESIINYSIGIAHYTIAHNINSPHYGLKYFFHRMINIEKLFNSKYIQDNITNIDFYKNNFETYDHNLKNLDIIYYNNKNKNKKISKDIIKLLYENIILYNKLTYYIFEYNNK